MVIQLYQTILFTCGIYFDHVNCFVCFIYLFWKCAWTKSGMAFHSLTASMWKLDWDFCSRQSSLKTRLHWVLSSWAGMIRSVGILPCLWSSRPLLSLQPADWLRVFAQHILNADFVLYPGPVHQSQHPVLGNLHGFHITRCNTVMPTVIKSHLFLLLCLTNNIQIVLCLTCIMKSGKNCQINILVIKKKTNKNIWKMAQAQNLFLIFAKIRLYFLAKKLEEKM